MQPENKPVTDYFIYNATFAALNSNTSQSANVQIQANSHFEVRKLAFTCFYGVAAADDNTTIALPAVTILITDTGSGRQWSDIAVPVSSMFGTAMLPAILNVPRVLPAASQIVVQANNLFTGQNIALLTLSFIGNKVYR